MTFPTLSFDVVQALGVRALELVKHVFDVLVVAINELAYRLHPVCMNAVASSAETAKHY